MKRKLLFYLFNAVLIIFLGYHLYYYFSYIFAIVRFDYLVDYGESFVLNQAYLLQNSWSVFDLYSSVEEAPFLLINYPPVYPVIVSLFENAEISFVTGRLVSVIATLGIVFFSVFFLFLFPLRNRMVLIFPFILLTTYSFHLWSGLYRVDMLALFFLMGGLTFLRWEKAPPFLSALFLILAVYTRQTLLPLPAAIFLGGILTGNRRWEKTFIFWLVGCFILLVIFQLLTGGEFFWHTVIGNRNELLVSNVMVWFRHLYRFSTFYILAWLFGLYCLLKQHYKEKEWILLIVLFSFFATLFVLTISKVGSAVNYLMEWYISMILVISLAAGWETRSWRKAVIYILLIAFLGNLCFMRRFEWRRRPEASDILTYRRLERDIHEYPYPVVSYDGGVLLMAGKEVVFQPFVLTQLHRQGLWNASLLMEYLHGYPEYKVIFNFPVEQEGRIRDDMFPLTLIEEVQKEGRQVAGYQFSYQDDLFCYIINNENE